MTMTADELIRLLEKNDFVYIRSNGSHKMYKKVFDDDRVVTVSIPYHKGDMKIGTVNAILRQAGLR